MNFVILIGRLTKDLELRKTTSGKSACKFNLAVTRDYKDANGEYGADFISCIAYNQTSELLCEYCKKGDLISVKGRIQTGNYEKNGEKIYTTDIIVEKISFLQPRKENKQEDNKKVETKQEEKTDAYQEFANEYELTDDMLPF